MTAEEANLMEEQLMAYYASQKEKWDRYAEEETAREKGIEQGREEERYSIARAMKAKGIDIHIISETTGLSVEELNNL